MTPERWAKIEDVFQSALDLSGAEREGFILEECGDDAEMLAEVRKFVARYETEDSFLESPVWTDSLLLQPSLKQQIASSLENEVPLPPEESFIGRQIGVYRLIGELGKGGMGMVYLGERADGEFHQKVAVKLIKRGMDTDFIVRRFRHERQILAALNHPNVARLFDGGTTDDNLPYFVMEFVEGKTFFKFCEMKGLDLRQKLDLFLQVCAAIAYAHHRKIIHRDIKPSNILVTNDGTPKLLDFGIAKILDPDLIHESIAPTATQMRLMTPEYASPEQARGDEITPTSDQYSLGVLLFELVTGARPYKFSSRAPHEIARVICESEPNNPSSADFFRTTNGNDLTDSHVITFKPNDDFCGKLDRIILKTLRKSPSERYASVKDLAADIKRLLKDLPVHAESSDHDKRILPPVKESFKTPAAPKSIAVLPLQILNSIKDKDTGGGQFLSIGLADALITRLSNIEQFVVRPTSSVLRYTERSADSFAAGRELNVEFILNGNIIQTNNRIRVSMQLLNVAKQSTVWAERFDEDFTDVLTLEDKISAKVAEQLVPQLTTGERQKLAKRGTDQPKAYEAYLRGRFYWNTFTEESFAKAFVAYHEAISHDADYALAYSGIADYYIWLGVYGVVPPKDCYPQAKDAARKAIELDDELADAYASLGFAQLCGDFDWTEAEKNAQRAVELNPNHAVAHLWYSYILLTAGRFDEGIAQAKRAVELDPLTYTNHHVLAWNYYFSRQFDEAVAQAAANVKKFSGIGLAYFTQSWILRFLGNYENSLAASQKAIELSGDSLFILLGYAQALAAAGKKVETEKTLQRIFGQGKRQYLSYYQVALIYAYAGETEKTLAALETAFEQREGWLIWLGVEPALDFLRGDDRFQSFLEKINHPLKNAALPPDISARGKMNLSEATMIVQTATPKRRLPFSLKYVFGGIAAVIAVFLLYIFFTNLTLDFSFNSMSPSESWMSSFASKMSLKRITNSGQEQLAAISPDGNLIAYVSKDDDRQSVWIRETNAGNPRQIAAPDTVLIAALSFSPDGQWIYYTAWSQNFISRNLYRVPVAGNNSPQLVLEKVNSGIGFAPDGKRFAYSSYDSKLRKSSLQLAELGAEGTVSSTRTLAEYTQPGFIRSYPSFAPDGKKFCYIVGETVQKKDSMSLYVFDLETNKSTKIESRTFGDISGITWRDNGGEIIISAAESDGLPHQLWAITYSSGEATRLTTDFGSYFDVSIARNSEILATAKREKTSAVWQINLESPDNGRQLSVGNNRLDGLNGVNWTADNRIVYVGGIGTQYSLMEMNADGSNNRALDVNVVKPSYPSPSKDKRFVIFADSKAEGSIIWRYDTISGALAQLTPNYAVTPTLTPDNRFVIYASNGSAQKLSLHKIPLEGGDEIEITSALSARPAVSPDGKWIACYYSGEETGNGWRIVVLSAENGEVRRVISPPNTFNLQLPIERPLKWSPDNQMLYYLNDKGNVSNIFRIAVEDETPPEQITRFISGRIFDFSLSPDGKQAVLSRGFSTSDVVIFRKAQ